MQNFKNIFLFLGSAAGIYSFIRLVRQDILSFFNKSKLTIKFNQRGDLKVWRVGPPYIPIGEIRKVATVHVCNKGKKSASNCEALVQIIKDGDEIGQTFPLHWADTPYDARSTSIEGINIGRLPRRLDVVFTQKKQNESGCSVASAQALATGVQHDQFFLPQGEHKIKIQVNYNSGDSIEETFVIESPDIWKNLKMIIL
ncbi:MAG: hypothetical protein K9M80_07830 [Candidatus Marinimicrobia bacterium]|nr:hypothetical protein [Candidatus Neomarinimicrobiota bacterium]